MNQAESHVRPMSTQTVSLGVLFERSTLIQFRSLQTEHRKVSEAARRISESALQRFSL